MKVVIGTSRMRRSVHTWLATMAILLVVAMMGALTEISFGPLEGFVSKWSYNLVLLGSASACLARGLLVPAGRRAWCLLGTSLVLWSLGNVYYSVALWDLSVIPVPSISDGFWIVFYPLAMVSVAWMVRDRVSTSGLYLWLDGAMGALAAGAVVGALLFGPLFEVASGHALALATNFSYPVGDLLLISMVVGAIGLSGWRIDSMWGWLGGGLVLFAVVDSVYLVQVANETWLPGNVFEAGWPAAMLCIAFAAWRPSWRTSEVDLYGTRVITMPLLFASVALALVVYDHFTRVNLVALVMASAALGVAVVRMTLSFRQNVAMLGSSRMEALTDSLTGLGNRRRLMLDLEGACVRDASDPMALIIFDLNGFKHYNDTFGHPAGDALLTRLGRSLAAAAGSDHAYRLGGDEFCVLVDCGDVTPENIATWLLATLSEKGNGFSIGAAAGWTVIPTEESNPSDALRRADRRMYESKNGGRVSEGRLAGNVLMQVLQERDPRLQVHLNGVASLAEEVCTQLGLSHAECQSVCLAAELHDVGKVAVPDEVLNKPGPLDDHEMDFIRQHTIIGQRILGVSPALTVVAELVRSSHEAYDGRGYPDGLKGEDIPLGSRIVAVCDAFDAMVSQRPYREAMTVREAIAELQRCAGTQFDPVVVDAFVAALVRGSDLVASGPALV
ncbi:MAG: bifunctional diguanylate cyclase/phosphohydrolase [Actinomycetota bacterium]